MIYLTLVVIGIMVLCVLAGTAIAYIFTEFFDIAFVAIAIASLGCVTHYIITHYPY